jgi:hypothetical protein
MATYRDELVRTCFEARRSVTWLETVEPRLKDQGLDAASMKSHHQSWFEKTEKEDWPRWQKEATRFSNAVLEQMRTDYFDQVDVLDMFRWLNEKADPAKEKFAKERFQQILNGRLDNEAKAPEPSRDQGRGM